MNGMNGMISLPILDTYDRLYGMYARASSVLDFDEIRSHLFIALWPNSVHHSASALV
jgi:hypothetical protein